MWKQMVSLCAFVVLISVVLGGCDTSPSKSQGSPIAYKDVDVTRMTHDTFSHLLLGISATDIAAAFGETYSYPQEEEAKRLASAKTFEEAGEVWEYAPDGSKMKEVAKEKMDV